MRYHISSSMQKDSNKGRKQNLEHQSNLNKL